MAYPETTTAARRSHDGRRPLPNTIGMLAHTYPGAATGICGRAFNRINAARRAIGDSGEPQQLIRTVRRRGLRFIGDVREESNRLLPEDSASSLPVSSAQTEPLVTLEGAGAAGGNARGASVPYEFRGNA